MLSTSTAIGIFLMGFSKAFDCSRHNLLLAKVEANGFSRESLYLIYSFLDNGHQRVLFFARLGRSPVDSSIVIQWFGVNFLKLNSDKCHLPILERNSSQMVALNKRKSVIENTEEEKLLGFVIDKKLTFDTHVGKLCKKAGSKIFAIACIAVYMAPNKLRMIMRAL